jgi:sialate O-acetylesterase
MMVKSCALARLARREFLPSDTVFLPETLAKFQSQTLRINIRFVRRSLNLRSILLLAVLPASLASSQLTVPKVLSDHMVVQRDLPVHMWGMAPPGEQVTVTFRGQTETGTSNRLGRWSVYLKPGAAGGPFEMKIMGEPGAASGSGVIAQEIVIHDILVGDVWIASGQSNMEFPLSRTATAAADLPHADNSHIHLLIVNKKAAEYPQDDLDTAGWAASAPDTAKDFSAVAWYFAREIEQREHVPVGVVDSTWGGTVAESWVRLTALGEDASLNPLFASRGKMLDRAPDTENQLKDEKRQHDEAQAQGKPIPEFPWHPPLPSWGPGNLWNGMIAPLAPFPIRGVLWYQGESNSALERWPLYDRIMRTLIEDWRGQWGQGEFPFFYVQISNFKSTPLEDWATLREQQVKTLGLRNTAMAVTIDIGNPDDVHPTDKVDVGHRLALAARALTYGESSLEYSGPMFRQATPESASIRAWFDHAKGLTAKGGEVTSVEIAGSDRKFVPAKATVDGETIVASSPDVPNPEVIRYGWSNSPQCNLFNGEGLPASPFTSTR